MNVLVLSTQFPYPPRSGFETRVYQLLRQLAQRHDVTLLSFAGPGERDDVAALAEEFPVRVVEWRPQSVIAKRLAQLGSIASSRPFACQSVYSPEMQAAITELCVVGGFDLVQLESSLFCQYEFPPEVTLVLDEHNIEYELFWRMCQSERSIARRTFNRVEYGRFRRFEQRAWTQVDGCLVTSEREVALVEGHASELPVAVAPNGVDLNYFRPDTEIVEPDTVVFNGVFNYRPNLDAALYLVTEIWPLVLARRPQARLSLVGRSGGEDMRPLHGPGIEVIGEVPDIRPHLGRAAVVAVPIRIGGGTRLKVVEGLAMGKAIVSTTVGCEGIAVSDDAHLLIADDAERFAEQIVRVFDDAALAQELGAAGRELVAHEYSWELAGERVERLLASVQAARVGAAS